MAKSIVPGTIVRLQAPAKINLYLKVLARRVDGYHELDTGMQKISLYDDLQLTILKEPGIILKCPDSDLPEDKTNLVWKAAAAFLQACDLEESFGLDIVLKKNIPVAAGLGGGSSDAGMVLQGLNILFDEPLSCKRLLGIARSIGADVPFFTMPYNAVRATGIGEVMEEVTPLLDCHIVLVKPVFSVSTRWVFEKIRLTTTGKNSNLSNFSGFNDKIFSEIRLVNDLETITIKEYPQLDTIKQHLVDSGADDVLMSGSGPTIFGIFRKFDGQQLSELVKELMQKYGDNVFVTRPLM